MRDIVNKFMRVGFVVLAAIVLSSCIKTDNSHCFDENCYLQFYYGVDEMGRGVEPEELEDIHLFIFDQDGIFVDEWFFNPMFRDSSEDPQTGRYYYGENRTLAPGSYYFIAWVNETEDFSTKPASFVKGQTTRAQAEYLLDRSTVSTPLKPVMYGETNLSTVTRKGTTVTVYLNQYSRKLNIFMKKEGTSSTDTFGYNVSDRNGRHFFQLHMGQSATAQPVGEEIDYRAVASVRQSTDNEFFGTMTVLRLWDRSGTRVDESENPRLVISQQNGDIIFDKDLIDIIQLAASEGTRSEGTRAAIDFDRRYEYNLYIVFDAYMNVSVGLDKWSYVNNVTPL